MANEPEIRIDVDLSIRVFGMDADGRPFTQSARARNVSEHGAKLSGLEHPLKAGDTIGLQMGDQKARCKVVWCVDAGAQKIEAGVKMVEGQPCLWQKEMEQKQQAAEPIPRSAPSVMDKRKFPRQRVPFSLEIQDENGPGRNMRTRAADINGCGCYVETLLPLPVGRNLNVSFWLDSEKITTKAIVRTCDGGVGMGIEFTALDETAQSRLQQQVEAMAAEAEASQKAKGGAV
jgi:PilZ domain